MILETGDYYIGDFHQKLWTGYGEYRGSFGYSYKGYWYQNMKHGYGEE